MTTKKIYVRNLQHLFTSLKKKIYDQCALMEPKGRQTMDSQEAQKLSKTQRTLERIILKIKLTDYKRNKLIRQHKKLIQY